jgi:hypothetical protein
MSQESPAEVSPAEAENLTCAECGEARPPGSKFCPACEDQPEPVQYAQAPPGTRSRRPSHGNTTR